MARKSKPSSHNKQPSSATSQQQTEKWLDLASEQMLQGEFSEVIVTCERLLNYLPSQSPQRVEVLSQLGLANAMLQNYQRTYDALTAAIALQPDDAHLWYNRSMACSFTLRYAQSYLDSERAVDLNEDPQLKRRLGKFLKSNHRTVRAAMRMRHLKFTFEQLLEQENLFHKGIALMESANWSDAEQAFRASIEMGDCLAQPWSNLGLCLLMQEKYDEAEQALKRALRLDRKYTITKDNLALLAQARLNGPPETLDLDNQFKKKKTKQTVKFVG